LYDLKDDGVTEVQLNGFYESIGYVIGLQLNDTEIKKVGNNAYITLYEDGGSVDDFSEYNFQVGDKLDLGSKGIKYFKQYDGEKIIVVDSKSDLKSSKGSYTYPSSVKKVLNKRYSTGGGVGKMELRKVYDGRYENSSKEEVLVIDAGIKDSEFTRFAIYDEILDFNVGNTKTKQEAISKLENYVKNNYNVVNKFDNGGDNTDLTKQEILSKYKGKYLDLLIGEDGKHQVIGVSNTKKPRYFLAEEWYNDLYAKGGNVSSIEKKVQEVNRLIDLANKNDISVIDSSSTWESPMKYKPIKYSNGTLYIEYQELDLYKNNRTGIKEYVTKKDKVLKRNMEFDNPLNDIAKMYRKALKQADIMFEDGGNVDSEYSFQGNTMMNGQYQPIYKKDGKYYIKYYNPTHYSFLADESDIKDYRIVKMYENGGTLGSQDIYKLAEEMSEKDFRDKFLTISKSEKDDVESLIRLGDDKKLALITILDKRNEPNNDDFYRQAYHYKTGGKVEDEKVYIDYMNKEKGFKRDRIYFDSYAEAVKWGKKNFERFNTDMINYV